VTDSDAVRSRRKRLHAAGDHSLCRHVLRGGAAAAAGLLVALPGPSGGPVDPHASLEALALRLEAAHEADPGNAMVARELRATLVTLSAPEDDLGFDVG
jgi:hypothetical protein